MHISAPQPTDSEIKVFFNIDASVGQQGSNANQDDILLVQFLLRLNGDSVIPASGPTGAARQVKMRAVPLSGICDEATISGIRAHQENMKSKMPGTIVDGRVSPARHFNYGGGYWSIVALNAYVRRHYPQQWPRLHDFAGCPAQLKARIPAEIL